MKIYTKISASLVAAVFAIAVMPVQADHNNTGAELSADGLTIMLTCDKFGGLEYTLDNHVFFASDGKGPYQGQDTGKDREGLEGKLTNAHDKLHEDPPKLCDAAQKLDDFSFKVQSLEDGNTADKFKIWDDTDGTSIQCLIEGSAALADDLRTDDQGQDIDCADDAGDPPRGKGPKGK